MVINAENHTDFAKYVLDKTGVASRLPTMTQEYSPTNLWQGVARCDPFISLHCVFLFIHYAAIPKLELLPTEYSP